MYTAVNPAFPIRYPLHGSFTMVEVGGIEPPSKQASIIWCSLVEFQDTPNSVESSDQEGCSTPTKGRECMIAFTISLAVPEATRFLLLRQTRLRRRWGGQVPRVPPSPYPTDLSPLGSFMGSSSPHMTPRPRILSREQASKVFVSLQRSFGFHSGTVSVQVGKQLASLN